MAFDLAVWRAESQQIITDFAQDPRAALARAGTNTLYGMLLGSTILPVVAAYTADPKSAMAALLGATGGLGANLIANLVQQKYDGANGLAIATQEAQAAELTPVYGKMAEALQVVPIAERALADAGQITMLEQLRAELRQLQAPSRSHNQTISGNARVGMAIAGDVHGNISHVQQSGGINLGSGNTFGQLGDLVAGDKVMRDKVSGNKIVNQHRLASDSTDLDIGSAPATVEPDRIRALINKHTRRLQILEEQAATFGRNVRPEVQTEIEDIQYELARLQALLHP